MKVKDKTINPVICALKQSNATTDPSIMEAIGPPDSGRQERINALRAIIAAGNYCPTGDEIAVAIFKRRMAE